jgi:hypothetical protein
MGCCRKRVAWLMVIALLLSCVTVAFAEDTVTVKGKMTKVDARQRIISVVDKDGKETIIAFEDPALFSRIERLKINVGDKVSVKYVTKGKQNVATYIRSLSGC